MIDKYLDCMCGVGVEFYDTQALYRWAKSNISRHDQEPAQDKKPWSSFI